MQGCGSWTEDLSAFQTGSGELVEIRAPRYQSYVCVWYLFECYRSLTQDRGGFRGGDGSIYDCLLGQYLLLVGSRRMSLWQG